MFREKHYNYVLSNVRAGSMYKTHYGNKLRDFAVEWATHMLLIRKVPGLRFSTETGYLNSDIPW